MSNRAALVVFTLVVLSARPLSADDTVDYLKHVKPILKERCFACHGALKQKGGLRLDTVAQMRTGGDNGPAVVPGNAAASLLWQRVSAPDPGRRMPPPSDGEPLPPQQAELLRRWIDSGAKGPAHEKPEEDPRDHWAFRKVVRPTVPFVADPEWRGNPIDAFIAAEHVKHGLTAQPLATPEQQLRRVYLDLIGLPPTRAELRAFLEECGTATPREVEVAYRKVVDRLLTSPHYGERWGRHWMDVWRYSDWYGRRYVPDVWNSAPQIWRWRDWIVQSLNADKGYDRMVLEMLAGDEIAPDDDQVAVATGFLVRNWYALNPHQWMRDNVEHTGKAFLGLTLNCCHCHDHKYDPISQEEYFRFWAFFEGIDVRQDRWPGEADPGPFQKYEYSTLRKIVKLGSVRVYDDKLDAKTYMYRGGDERNKMKDRPPVRPAAPAFLGGDRLVPTPVTLPATVVQPGLKPFIVAAETQKREDAVAAATAQLRRIQTERASRPAEDGLAAAIKLAELRLKAAQTELAAYQARLYAERIRHRLASGDWKSAAATAGRLERTAALAAAQEKTFVSEQEVSAARHRLAKAEAKDKDAAAKALKAAEQQWEAAKKALVAAEKNAVGAAETYKPLGPTYPPTSSGRRTALARWIASPDNPLTARVAVNHIWLRHFDRPLVETVYDFGRNGKPPSHPALLDWLAAELMSSSAPHPSSPSNWSMKHLHRLIVTSRVYRLQSAVGANPAAAKDPDNRCYWRGHAKRLEAEAIRDGLLHVAGELDLTLGGPTLENSEEGTSKRRSLYFAIYPEDGGHLKFLELFDAPDACECYRRSDSIVPQQALALTNNELIVTVSRAAARRLQEQLENSGDDESFITMAFEQVLARLPRSEERAACQAFLSKQRDLYRSAGIHSPAELVGRARESLVRALLNHNDFVTVR